MRCHFKCVITESMVFTEALYSNALSKKRYRDVNSTVIYCTNNFILG
jgi:hypothetical protein